MCTTMIANKDPSPLAPKQNDLVYQWFDRGSCSSIVQVRGLIYLYIVRGLIGDLALV